MLALSFGLVACGDDGGAADDNGVADSTSDTGNTSMPDSGEVDPDDSGGCVMGNVGCACLEGQCAGGLFCVEAMCVQGPQVEIDEAPAVVAGIVVPLEADIDADEFSWSQVSGPTVEILGDGMAIAIPVPADAAAGESITLRLSSSRNGVSREDDVSIDIIDAVFENTLSMVTDPAELGTPEGIDFGANGMWVVSAEGFVSRFDTKGGFVGRVDLTGSPLGLGFMGENMIIPNTEGTGRVEQVNSASNNISTLFDGVIGGGILGLVDHIMVEDDEVAFVSNGAGGQVFRYDVNQGGAGVFLDMPGETFGAMAFGPEGNNMLYVGLAGAVWRVPVDNDGLAGDPQDYLDLGDATCEVTGLVFDEGNNLWVGCPGASFLAVAPYSVNGPTEVSRSWSNEGAVSGFARLVFGEDDFGQRALFYTNATDGTVGRLQVGLQRL